MKPVVGTVQGLDPVTRQRSTNARVGRADALSPTMTWREFENGYWYLGQLKDFAERIGIPAAKKLRKDELEKYIVLNKMPRFERVPHDRYIKLRR